MTTLNVLSFRVLLGWTILVLVPASAVLASPAESGELPPERLSAWEEYRGLTEARIARELASDAGFLAGDFLDPADVVRDRETLLSGEPVMASMETLRPDGSHIDVPGGMIHHWRGAILIPGVTLEEVLEDVIYPDDTEFGQEDVLESRVLGRGDNSFRVYLKLVRKKIVTATYNTEHQVEYSRRGEGRAVSRTIATRIRELENAGMPEEREKPVGEDRGFLWRLNSYWRYEEVDGGVLVECESLTLSRSIPFFLAPLVRPIVSGVAKESLNRTLTSLKDRIVTRRGQNQELDAVAVVE
jgi:hypothetical protein